MATRTVWRENNAARKIQEGNRSKERRCSISAFHSARWPVPKREEVSFQVLIIDERTGMNISGSPPDICLIVHCSDDEGDVSARRDVVALQSDCLFMLFRKACRSFCPTWYPGSRIPAIAAVLTLNLILSWL